MMKRTEVKIECMLKLIDRYIWNFFLIALKSCLKSISISKQTTRPWCILQINRNSILSFKKYQLRGFVQWSFLNINRKKIILTQRLTCDLLLIF
ncbi:hypothetical protein BpHYR1_040663 [Brachionus plicatilis]|uniref:Uncharacterized protein n=1 Tax=Brachionus plicatilis TaxID=10195 RepID=A0A3M7RMT2_BRAPC|nr:hypothetical protein BpHYR1_040663 [Brachionus plicatilis]